MEQRPLGRTGLTVSAIGFGCGAVGGLMVKGEPADQTRAVARAIEAGITYFDTARSYGDGRSEENLGRVLAELGADVVVGTKFRIEPTDADLARAVEVSLVGSLRRLRRERVHLFQLHNRIGEGDGALSLESARGPVADALEHLRDRGLIDHWGLTAMGETDLVRQVVESGRYQCAQVYFNAVNPSAGYAGHNASHEQDFDGLIDRASAAGVGVINIRALAAGAVAATGRQHPNAGGFGGSMAGSTYERDRVRAAALTDLSGALGLEGPVELALRFNLAKPGVSTVLVGLSDQAQLEEALRYGERGPLSPDAVERVLAVARA
jgi:aryl-alcohol dehydrogenase-like predicted oxidoreductase